MIQPIWISTENSGEYIDEITSDTSDQPMGDESIDTMNTDLNDAFDQYIAGATVPVENDDDSGDNKQHGVDYLPEHLDAFHWKIPVSDSILCSEVPSLLLLAN